MIAAEGWWVCYRYKIGGVFQDTEVHRVVALRQEGGRWFASYVTDGLIESVAIGENARLSRSPGFEAWLDE